MPVTFGSLLRAVTKAVEFLRSSKHKVALIIAVMLVTLVVSTVISILLSRTYSLNFPSIGTIYTVGVEASGGDIQTAGELKFIDWGATYTGTTTNRSFYLRSLSNVEAALQLDATNWMFRDSIGRAVAGPDPQYMNLSWNYNGTALDLNETIEVTLYLSFSHSPYFRNYLILNDVKTFSFTIMIQTSKHGS